MKIVLFLIISLFSYSTFSEVVKVTSSNCINEFQDKSGSGIIFNYKTDTYVVTSEHVVFNNKKFCYQAGESQLDLIRSDWASGLALLKLKSIKVKPITNLEDFITPVEDKSLSIVGYPHKSSSLRKIENIKINSLNSSEQAFLLDRDLLEVSGQAEFGMSGGAMIQERRIVGLSTHVSAKIKPQTFAIRGDTVKKWILKVVNENFDTGLVSESVESFEVNGIKFKKNTFNNGDNIHLANSGDPVGVGGAIQRFDLTNITISLDLKDFYKKDSKHLQVDFYKSIELIKRKMLRRSQLSISYFHDTETSRLLSINSLQQFARYLSLGYRPIFRSQNYFSRGNEEEVLMSTSRDLAKIMSLLILKYDDLSSYSLFRDIQELVTLSLSGSWPMLSYKHIESLINHKNWDDIFKNELIYDEMVEIISLLDRYLSNFKLLILEV